MALVFFHWKSANVVISENANIDCILAHHFYFFWLFLSLYRIFFINTVPVLIMSAKVTTPRLLRIQIF